MSRSREEIARDRGDLVALLQEAGEPLRTDVLICRAFNLPDPTGKTAHSGWRRHHSQVDGDLRALARHGVVSWRPSNGVASTLWSLGGDARADQEDERDVARMMASWEPA